MASLGLGFACKPHLPLRLPQFRCIRRVCFSSVAAVRTLDEAEHRQTRNRVREGYREAPEWKALTSKELGISTSKIPKPTRRVLKALKAEGYEVYLVGGCVRDLILKRIPKDFDILTSARLHEVLKAFDRKQKVKGFTWCGIVGRRFPICHVHIDGTIVEVSSFSTMGKLMSIECPVECNKKDYVRWRNCAQRDFTINGLMFDPYAKIVYDYMGGLEDIKKAKVRTVIPAVTSFQDDCARILRAVRLAARLGFQFTRETAHFVKSLAPSISRLDKMRLMMEMNYMLAYGSAEASLRRLWKFGLLEILLPVQAAYFVRNGFRRCDRRSNMLLALFSNLDKLLAPDRPCHSSLWVAILAFHEALSNQPRDPVVVATFCLAVHNGGNILEALRMAKQITKPHDASFYELSEPCDLDSQLLTNEVLDLAASVKTMLSRMTDQHSVSQAMQDYPQAPHSDVVFIPLTVELEAHSIFDWVGAGREKGFRSKRGNKINYEMLALGHLPEVRYIFARTVFDTVYPLNLS
ncbi:hypothetical protein Tsubulata_000641 [Turnera subulata]|uniref:Poly A polymerase head domain-containing protein n=1 Tax=Turnera subulata TaxID=218843 RepID=A0A9Q0JRI4_9ROSI|nr:hypothetical protein Tsubulata_000641 [Turnera subulata]